MEAQDLQISAKVGNRPVWVVNDFDYDRHPEIGEVPYREDFRGETIEIPARGKIKMPYLAAERFIGQPTMPSNLCRLPNGKYVNLPKALKIVEFTEAELKEVGLSKKALETAEKDDADKVKRTCTICGQVAASEKGLKIHVTKNHPDAIEAVDE